jgi:hypothetical protein
LEQQRRYLTKLRYGHVHKLGEEDHPAEVEQQEPPVCEREKETRTAQKCNTVISRSGIDEPERRDCRISRAAQSNE